MGNESFFGGNLVGQEQWERRGEPTTAASVSAGTFGGSAYEFLGRITVDNGIELYHPSSTPYIDFHRAANAAGDSSADFNVRMINESDNVVNIYTATAADTNTGGRLYVGNAWMGSHPVHGVNGWAGFGHKNMQATSNFGFLQLNTGMSIVNAPATKQINLSIDNSGKLIVYDGVTDVAQNMNLLQNKLYTKANIDENHRIKHNSATDSLEINSWLQLRFYRGASGGVLTSYLSDDVWCSGRYRGNWGGAGNGVGLEDRGGDNVISVDWTGTLQFHVDNAGAQKTFVIDHPLDKEKYLIHACLEGPEAGVYYRGQGQLDGGWVEVKLPDYFESLCAEEGRSVQLTCIADDPADEWCPVLHATYPKGGRFYVGLGSGMIINDQRFWWEVKAVRKDVAPTNVEPTKDSVEVMGSGPYRYYKER